MFRGFRNSIPEVKVLDAGVVHLVTQQQYTAAGEPLITDDVRQVVDLQRKLILAHKISGDLPSKQSKFSRHHTRFTQVPLYTRYTTCWNEKRRRQPQSVSLSECANNSFIPWKVPTI